MQIIAIEGTTRTDLGKKATKKIRREKQIPCVVYGGKENIHFSAPISDFRHLVYSPDFKIAEINIGGTITRASMKNIQFHPVTDEILHMDFVELVAGKKIKLDIPVKLVGVSEGSKKGGAVMSKLRRVKVETTPENMVDVLEADITKLELGQSVRVHEIKKVEGVTVLSPPNTPIASVEVPRALRSAAASEEGEEAADEE